MSPISTLLTIFVAILIPAAAVLAYLSRKFGADLQARVGPNRAGPAGMLQPLADFLKMLQKEEAASAATVSQQCVLALQASVLLSTAALLPLGSALLLVDTDMSLFLVLWSALSVALLSLFVALQRGNMPGWLGGIRVAIQAIAGVFPALLAILCVGVNAGGFRWEQILAVQGAFPQGWMVFSNPFAPFAFLVFVIAGLIVFDIPPMDSGSERQELVGGVRSIWGGRNLVLANFMRFYGFFLWSCLTAALFLGGWRVPGASQDGAISGSFATTLETIVLLIKVFAVMIGVTAIARVTSRTRADQVTGFSWRVLSPVALLALVGSALWRMWLA